jgi:serine/threonine-protein kinase
VSIACQILAGLHAAHEMVDEVGMPLHVVHRDVSPQNVMIATDGTARLLDFGVAKASMAAHTTREGTYKGKLAYSAPEQLRGSATRQSDLYSLAVMLWELIVGHRMHGAQSETELVTTIMNGTLPTITETLAGEREWGGLGDDTWAQLVALDPLIRKGLAVELSHRFATATEMEEALIRVVPPAASSAVATWLKALGRDYLEKNDRVIAAEETSWRRIAQPITNSRRTPVPGAVRSATAADTSHGRGSLPPHPASRKGSSAIVALLGALVIAAAIVIVLLARRDGEHTAASPVPAAVAAPGPTTHAREEPAAIVPPAIEPPAPMPSVAAREPESRPMAPASRKPARTLPRPTARVTREPAPRPRPETFEPPGSNVEAAPAADCNPPYYFQGSKKIFKPACL